MSFLNVVGALTAVASPANAEVISLQAKGESPDDKRVPIPSHRHASPSAPWPWVDLDDGEPMHLEQFRQPSNTSQNNRSRSRPVQKPCACNTPILSTRPRFLQQLLARLPSISIPQLDLCSSCPEQNTAGNHGV